MLLSTSGRGNESLDLHGAGPPPPLAELVVHGVNNAADPKTVVVRIDDRPNPAYADRVNEERLVPPGPFTFRLRLASLRTPRGRALDLTAARSATVFAPAQGPVLDGLVIEQAAALPAGTHGWFFGPADAAPLRGFDSVSVKDPAVSGPSLNEIHRPGQDPVLTWGMRLTRFEGTLPPGRWHLTLWTEDPGEWETLPEVLERRIRVNGSDILLERRDHATWRRERYFAGHDREASPDQTPFQALGAYRGGRVEADVTLPDGHFVLELAGHPQAATHLALLTAAPMDQPHAAEEAVEAVRAARFAEAWPVLSVPVPTSPPAALTLEGETHTVTAPGGLAIFRLTATAPAAMEAKTVVDGDGARLLWGMWRWRRPAPETPGLVLSPAHARADSAVVPLRPDLPRPLTVLLPIPAGALPGERRLRLTLATDHGEVTQTLIAEILPIRRPIPTARVGAFLDFAPDLSGDTDGARRQASCDLATLRSLGLTAVAPPLTTPDKDGLALFLADLRAAQAQFQPPYIAYSPARRLSWTLGFTEAGLAVARADAAAEAAHLTPPVWTVADEPSAAGTMDQALALADKLRLANRDAKLAGHLNDPADDRIVRDLDLVTVNARFGADADAVAALATGQRQVWLYNMPRQRLAGGFYLWRSGASGLLQWHARMPTADAFDPTDGREGDVQFLWPAREVCQSQDLDTDVLELADAAEDLRWIAWLESAAKARRPGAAALLDGLRAAVPATWSGAVALPVSAPATWRARIVDLARKLS